jgi:hypothetical protein
LALAKQTGQVRLHRLVRYTLARLVAEVEIAEAAIVGTAGGGGDDGVFQAAIVAERPLLHLEIEPGVGGDDVAEIAVVRAVLLHHDFAGIFADGGINQLRAIGQRDWVVLGRPFGSA